VKVEVLADEEVPWQAVPFFQVDEARHEGDRDRRGEP